jgi:hypothetical protein
MILPLFREFKAKHIASLFVLCTAYSIVSAQINCPPNLPFTLVGNTEYCVGTNGSELSVPESYAGYEWLPTTEIGQSVLLTAGSYQLVVTHYTGCTDTLDFEVEQVSNPPQPTVTASGPTEFCEGESVTLSGPTGYPYYEWSSGSISESITVYESGTFVLSIEDWIGCVSASNTIEVTVNPYPTAVFSPYLNMFDVSFNNLSIDADTYLWDFGDGNTSTGFEPSHTFNFNGTVEMYLVAENGCGTDTAFLNLASVDIQEQEDADIMVYPNPASDDVFIELTGKGSSQMLVQITDLSGRVVYKRTQYLETGRNKFNIKTDEFDDGVYTISLVNDDEELYSELLIIQR